MEEGYLPVFFNTPGPHDEHLNELKSDVSKNWAVIGEAGSKSKFERALTLS